LAKLFASLKKTPENGTKKALGLREEGRWLMSHMLFYANFSIIICVIVNKIVTFARK